MKDAIQQAIETFPDHEDTIRRLGDTSVNFNATCQAFGAAREALRQLERSADADAELRSDALRRRCADLETELLAMMQQNMRV